jgi:hypothetical protein
MGIKVEGTEALHVHAPRMKKHSVTSGWMS